MTTAILGALVALAVPVLAEAQSITVDAKHHVARVSRQLFGTNVRQNMESDGKVRDFLKETGITVFRYPDSVDSAVIYIMASVGLFAWGLLSFPSLERAIAKNGSISAYAFCAANLGMYVSVLACLGGGVAVWLWRWFRRRKES